MTPPMHPGRLPTDSLQRSPTWTDWRLLLAFALSILAHGLFFLTLRNSPETFSDAGQAKPEKSIEVALTTLPAKKPQLKPAKPAPPPPAPSPKPSWPVVPPPHQFEAFPKPEPKPPKPKPVNPAKKIQPQPPKPRPPKPEEPKSVEPPAEPRVPEPIEPPPEPEEPKPVEPPKPIVPEPVEPPPEPPKPQEPKPVEAQPKKPPEPEPEPAEPPPLEPSEPPAPEPAEPVEPVKTAKPKPGKPKRKPGRTEPVPEFKDEFQQLSKSYERDNLASQDRLSESSQAKADNGTKPGSILNINPRIFYPQHAIRRNLQGVVVVLIHISPDGHTDGVDLLQSSGHQELDEVVQGAVQHWRFKPPMRGNTPVAGTYRHRVIFGADEQVTDDFATHWREVKLFPEK